MQATTKPGTANTWLFAFLAQGAKLALIHEKTASLKAAQTQARRARLSNFEAEAVDEVELLAEPSPCILNHWRWN